MSLTTTPQAAQPSWPSIFSCLLGRVDLSTRQSRWAMDTIMAGEATHSQIAGFLVALRAKGESVDELIGLVQAMLGRAHRIEVAGPTLDIVGTGGDGLNTLNISTMSSLVAVGAGATVVKHGNRGASSASGAADVIEELGVRLDLAPAQVAATAVEAGITFCFAQVFHPSMKHVAVPRRELGIPTTFNFLGPLSNPAGVGAQALGCADARMAPLMAGVLAARGVRALVFRGDDGRDKLTTSGSSTLWEVRDGAVDAHVVHPADFGLDVVPVDALRGTDATGNAAVVRSVLRGDAGPVRDAVVLNTAAGLVAFDEAAEGPLVERMRTAMVRAAESIDSGAAAAVLDRWITVSRAF
ncbi:anthranilate phosphoribosyltransferase [Arthrobacter agilis]|uniref:anthranilate phosphoribosyltransferase n=1 Tax=Arthrobacter agilis TaxID=37921 RepID=UPI000B351D93|nr:anthranilate phosphoribosyltransferase [Arthrobacter agilis]PPB47344.1 anthranilate phosphoribosyltransferase [Arthrobacter agilis]TPV22866.1 anthranilate phosphoribosyltransferase [Arthrobacter agilis]